MVIKHFFLISIDIPARSLMLHQATSPALFRNLILIFVWVGRKKGGENKNSLLCRIGYHFALFTHKEDICHVSAACVRQQFFMLKWERDEERKISKTQQGDLRLGGEFSHVRRAQLSIGKHWEMMTCSHLGERHANNGDRKPQNRQ